MIRGIFGTILWGCVAACIGVGLFFIKHEVKDQERHLTSLNTEIQRNQETIHVLRAEWSYLNDPARLRALSEKHLGMHPVMPTQVATLDSVLRNGLPTGAMLASAAPIRPSAQAVIQTPSPMARVAEPAPRQQIKLVDSQSRPRPIDMGKPAAPKPQPSKPGGVTLANSAPPPTPVVSAATTPARGGKIIIVQSPALAQSDGEGR
ncbi:MAG: energy transducer TonB [Phaeospirillum sp.]|nr:energy transducer TonB [Phaeospirillum sp.]